MILFFRNPFEILLNIVQYDFGFRFPELLFKPFSGIGLIFSVIATVYTLTQRNNVGRNSAGAIFGDQRYPVVSSKSVPQSPWSTANSATIIKILKAVQPIFGHFSNTSAATRIQAVCPGDVFTEVCFEYPFVAAGTSFKGSRIVDHSTFTSCCLPDVVSASGGKNHRSGATLADAYIIPRKVGL